MLRTAVMGTGGVGGYFGGLLANAGGEVAFIARGPHLDAIRRAGLRVTSDLSGDFTVHATVTDDPGSVGPVDLVLYTVKMYDNDDAIRAAAPLIGPDTVLLTLQNGIDNADWLSAAIGADHVMIGVAILQSRISAPGVVEQRGQLGQVIFGETGGGRSPRGKRLLEVFRGGGWNVELSDNAPGALWRKFTFLTASAGVNAVSQIPYGEMRAVPETLALLRTAYEEIIAVGVAAGAPLDHDILEWCMTALENFPADGMSSLANDFRAGRRVELEGLTGTVIRLGRDLGVPTPVNSTIYALLKPAALRVETP